MIIECPYCSTRFRLDVETLGERHPTLRCSQCRNTFPLPPPPEDEDLSFSYDEDPQWEESEEEPAERREPEQFSFPLTAAERDRDPQPTLFDESDDVFVPEPEADRRAAEPARAGDGGGGLMAYRIPLFVFLGLVVAAYGLLSSTLRSNPDWTRQILQTFPLIGSEVKASKLGREVVLDDLVGRYETTKEGARIFLVTGAARNEHDQPVRDIRIELTLLDDAGNAVAEQSTTCGTAMRAELVRDLTMQQVAILRGWGIKPPEDTAVNPGESCPLVSIFLEAPAAVTELSAEVVHARRVGRS